MNWTPLVADPPFWPVLRNTCLKPHFCTCPLPPESFSKTRLGVSLLGSQLCSVSCLSTLMFVKFQSLREMRKDTLLWTPKILGELDQSTADRFLFLRNQPKRVTCWSGLWGRTGLNPFQIHLPMKLPLPPWTCPYLEPQPSQHGRRPDAIPAPGIPWTLDACAESPRLSAPFFVRMQLSLCPHVPHFVSSFLSTRSSSCLKWHFATWSEGKLRLQEAEAFAWNFDMAYWAPACSFWSTAQSRLTVSLTLRGGGPLFLSPFTHLYIMSSLSYYKAVSLIFF